MYYNTQISNIQMYVVVVVVIIIIIIIIELLNITWSFFPRNSDLLYGNKGSRGISNF